jgi:hypothetical protein
LQSKKGVFFRNFASMEEESERAATAVAGANVVVVVVVLLQPGSCTSLDFVSTSVAEAEKSPRLDES